jgi:hypothetical protein
MKLSILASLVNIALSSKADFSTSNLAKIRSGGDVPGALLGKLKATFDTEVDLGGHKATLAADCEGTVDDIISAPTKSLKEASLTGGYSPHSQVKMGYKLSHNFESAVQTVKTSVSGWGVGAKAQASSDGKAAVTDVTWGILEPYDIKACGSKFVVDAGLKLKGVGGFTKPPIFTLKTAGGASAPSSTSRASP